MAVSSGQTVVWAGAACGDRHCGGDRAPAQTSHLPSPHRRESACAVGVKIGRRSRVNFGRRLTVTDSRFYEYAPFSILRLAYYGGFDDFELPKMIDLRPTPTPSAA